MAIVRVPVWFRGSIAAATTVAVVLSLSACNPYPGGGIVSTVDAVDFNNPLVIPPLADSTIDANGNRVFNLTAQQGTSEFVAGRSTTTWGFNGNYLGPTLVAHEGENVVVTINNSLSESTTVHWHGMHLPAAMDGGPHQLIASGESASPTWTIKQQAATLWYHPHLMGQTEHQTSMGLDGLFIIQDDAEAALDLPRTYGVDDIPVVVSDVRFDAEGQFDNSVQGYIGTLGDELLVNGTHAPYLDVSTDLVRLRLLNASTSRVYDFGFSDDRAFSMIASDGGLLEEPHETSAIQLSPGERAEIVVRMVAGESTVLRSSPPDLGMSTASSELNGGADSFDVLQLRASATLTQEPLLPEILVPMTALAANDAAQIRSMVLNDAMINNTAMDMDRIDLVAHLDTSEVWVVSNAMALPHNFHVHDVQFQILDISRQKPPPELAGWKDTIYVPPGAQFRLIMRFTDYADPRNPYMFHCHLLTHEDKGMMGQFVVIEPGDEALVGIAAGSTRGATAGMDSGMGML